MTLVCEDDRQIEVHKAILPASGPVLIMMVILIDGDVLGKVDEIMIAYQDL